MRCCLWRRSSCILAQPSPSPPPRLVERQAALVCKVADVVAASVGHHLTEHLNEKVSFASDQSSRGTSSVSLRWETTPSGASPAAVAKKVVRILLERGGTVRWEELHNFQRISWRRAPHMINPGSAVVSVTLQLPG